MTNSSSVGLIDFEMAERLRAVSAAVSLAQDDLAVIEAVPWERYEREASTDIQRIWFDWARFRLWERPESELRDRIAALTPLFGAALS